MAAVRASAAPEPHESADSGVPELSGPIRTCIGCRSRAPATELLRVVVARDAPAGSSVQVVPDPRSRAPGRGAWLHPDLKCVEFAERRRAFARALRVPGPIDPAPVREYVAPTAPSESSAESTAKPR